MAESAAVAPLPSPGRRRRLLRIAGWTLLGFVGSIVVVVVTAFWLLGREATLQRIVSEGEKALGGQLQVVGVTGSLYDHVAFTRLVFRSKTQIVTVENGALRYRLEPIARRFTITEARAATLTIETIAKSEGPSKEPDTLALPSALRLDTVRLEAVHLDAIRLVDATKTDATDATDATNTTGTKATGTTTTVLGPADLVARYGSEAGTLRWTVERIAVVTPWGKAEGNGKLDAKKPFAIDAKITASGAIDDVPYDAPLTVRGALGDLVLSSDFTVSDPRRTQLAGHADARVLTFREQPIDHASLHVGGFSPKRWKDTLPDADVTVDAVITPLALSVGSASGRNPFRGTLKVVNAKPGPVDAGRIPVAVLEAAVHGDADAIDIDRVRADLGAAGSLEGRGRYAFAGGGEPSFEGTVARLDLKALQGSLIKTRFDGPVAVSRRGGVTAFDTTLADAGRHVVVKGTFVDETVTLAVADLVVGGSHVAASGKLGLGRNRPFEIAADLTHVDPHDFGDFTKADVNAAIRLDGSLGAPPDPRRPEDFTVRADVRIDPSRVLERPVAGTIAGRVTGVVASSAPKGKSPIALRSIDGAHVALAIGANRLTADGDFGRAADRLRWTVDAPKLVELDAGLGGLVKGTGMLGGTPDAPSLEFDVAADALRYAKSNAAVARSSPSLAPTTSSVPTTTNAPAGSAANVVVAAKTTTTVLSLKSLRANGRIESGQKGVVDMTASLSEFRDGASPTPTVQAATLRIEGRRDGHRLAATASSDRFDVTIGAAGGLEPGNTWRGDVTRLDSRGRVPFALAGTTPLVAGPDQLRLGAATLKFQEGELGVDHLTYLEGRLDTAGRATGIPLAIVGSFSKDFASRVSTTLTFGATWNVQAADAINGRVRVFRESGNLRLLTEPRLDVDVQKLELDADIVADRVATHLVAISSALGNVDATVATTFAKRDGQWGLPGTAPLAMTGAADIPDLQGLARLSGVEGLLVTGSLKADVTANGTVGRPLLGGRASGQALAIRWPDQGVSVRDGRFDVAFEGDRIVLGQATFAAGRGTMNAKGDLRLEEGAVTGMLDVDFEHFEAVARSDRTMTVSGNGGLRFGPNGIEVTGDVKADRGVLQLAERHGPTMSSDIVIVGRDGVDGSDDDVKAPAKSVPVRFDIRFDMGDDFGVKGSGFDGKLGGNIRIGGTGSDLRAIGTVAVREGTYEGYGQKLTITRGNLVFSGPIDNPALNILAIRKGLAVEAGVQVSGTALAPVARLVSTPDVPDTEKLSWLILGHGLAGATKSDYATLATAAAGLFGSSNSTGIQARIAATLGVDQVGFTTDSTTGAGLLTIGKQISSRLRVSFEQGLTKAATLVKVRYNIYQRIDLQVTAGTESAVDVFYTFSFN